MGDPDRYLALLDAIDETPPDRIPLTAPPPGQAIALRNARLTAARARREIARLTREVKGANHAEQT